VAIQLDRIARAATLAASAGLEVHAGHGLTYNTVAAVARLPEIIELNIGHFLIGEAIFGGLHGAVQRMRHLMVEARANLHQQRNA
jgi:pyridoxine 5-phosphate synthase